MANKSASPLLTFIRRIAARNSHCDLTDSELLQRFAAGRDQLAFSTLMHRHGPMVLAVCQGVLQNVQDAEDVFQATFLVLVRKPKSIGKPTSVASWLHGVAYRLAMKARAQAARRRVCERQAITMPNGQSQEEVIWRDLRPVLHQEVDRLPERYRLPFVLCYLEGKTNEEAAALLGWPKGTVLSSLSRARERLRARLTRRGVALTGSLLAALLSQQAASGAVPTALTESTLKAALLFAAGPGAAGGIAAPALAHAEAMVRALFVAKLKLTAIILLAGAVAGTGAGVVHHFRNIVPEHIASSNSPPPSLPQRNPAPLVQASQQLAENKDTLQGAWIVTAAEQRGRRITLLNGRRFAFTERRFTLSEGGEVSGILPRAGLEGDLRLESTGSKRIDLNQRSWHLHGIYELKGDNLKICLTNEPDSERPAEFTTRPENRHLLLELKRE